MAVASPALSGLARFRPIGPGSRVALVAPASPFLRADFDAGLAELGRLDLVPIYDDRVFARDPIVAGSATLRADALREYFARPDIDAILAVRGGYGSAETLPFLNASAIRGSLRASHRPGGGASSVRGPRVSLIPKRQTIWRAISVARERSSSAPVERSPHAMRSAARPPKRTQMRSRSSSVVRR